MRDRIRVGNGFDIHRLEEPYGPNIQRSFRLGGIDVSHSLVPVGRTDADAVLHAITDAILGALALPGMGELFADDDTRQHSSDSAIYLQEADARIRHCGWEIGNVDVTVILETPRLREYIPAMRRRIAEIVSSRFDQVNVKAKTAEGIGEIGRGSAVVVYATVLLIKGAW